MPTFLSDQGLWKQDIAPSSCRCGLPTSSGYSDEFDSPVTPACSLTCWGEYWDSKVKPNGGKKAPRTSADTVESMKKWSHRVRAMSALKRERPGLHIYQSGQLDVIEYRLLDLSLAGVLFHFPRLTKDGRRLPGQIAVWVYPAHQGQGIGSKLGCAAARRFGINLGVQSWSKMGVGMARKAFRNHPDTPEYRKAPDGSN